MLDCGLESCATVFERRLVVRVEQADKLIAASQDRTKKIMEPVAPKIREELKQTKDQFRALLTPEQQTRFDEMLKKPPHSRDSRGRMPGKSEKAPGGGDGAE